MGRLWDRGWLGRAVITAAVGGVSPSVVDGEGGGERGEIDGPADEAAFPLRLSFKRPSSRDLSERFDEVRGWVDDLAATPGVRIERRRVNHRILGTNDVPAEAWVDSLDDALTLAARRTEAATLARMALATRQRRPDALILLRQRPVSTLAQADVWERLLDLVDWIEAHPAPGVYLRQVDLPGIDTKLIESHRPMLCELIDTLVPSAVVDVGATGVRGFERRYGFRSKPNLIRFRILDPGRQMVGLGPRVASGDDGYRPAGLEFADVTVDAATFAGLDLDVDTVFLVENEINFLVFPPSEAAMVVWVAGFGTARLAAARWLDGRALRYWGDLDTHGFAILDELRQRFPRVESFLMDRQTLFAHRALWVDEPRPERRDLPRLTGAEAELYDDLRWDRLGERVRLEQERIGYRHLLATIDPIDPASSH